MQRLLTNSRQRLSRQRFAAASHWICRQAPVITVTGAATAGAILAARDAGVHEFLRKPYSMKDLVRRLEAWMKRLQPRFRPERECRTWQRLLAEVARAARARGDQPSA